MMLKRLSRKRFRVLCSPLFLVLVVTMPTLEMVSAQEQYLSDKPATPVSKPVGDTKVSDAITALIPSIVTVTRSVPEGEHSSEQPLSHRGVVIDPRGYIAIPMLPGPTQRFMVRLSNQKETAAELYAVDQSLKVGLLKIEQHLPVQAVSPESCRNARNEEPVQLVPSPDGVESRTGRIISTAFDFGEEGSTKLIQTDIACPLTEFGSLIASPSGEPLGLLMTSRSAPKPMSYGLPLAAIQTVLQSVIDKPKDAPMVNLPKFAREIDVHKPVAITLQPVPPLAESLVELFASRGAKILDHEDGKHLKIEAPPLVLEELANLLALVALAEKPDPEGFDAKQLFKIQLEPATPLANSLVELFADRGAQVLDYVAGKRLEIQAPPKVMDQLGKILAVVARESQRSAVMSDAGKSAEKSAQTQGGQESRPKVLNTAGDLTDQPVADSLPPKPHAYIQEGRDSHEVTKSFHLQTSDAASMFDVVEALFQGRVRRISADRRTNSLIVVALPSICNEVEAVILKLDSLPARRSPAHISHQSLPDTPAAKELVERLETEEFQAATVAKRIRKLQAKGDAAESLEPHQSQLKAHLQTAFELKIQLEELQVKELKSRLSRLEGLIDQRKDRREKIIERRAAELISGDSLGWNTETTSEP